jgi:hypothetical protein
MEQYFIIVGIMNTLDHVLQSSKYTSATVAELFHYLHRTSLTVFINHVKLHWQDGLVITAILG